MRLIHGSVDKDTQRVAFRIGEGNDSVVKVGLAGLAEPETPMWVHFGNRETQTWTLIRLEAPPSIQKEWDTQPPVSPSTPGTKTPPPAP